MSVLVNVVRLPQILVEQLREEEEPMVDCQEGVGGRPLTELPQKEDHVFVDVLRMLHFSVGELGGLQHAAVLLQTAPAQPEPPFLEVRPLQVLQQQRLQTEAARGDVDPQPHQVADIVVGCGHCDGTVVFSSHSDEVVVESEGIVAGLTLLAGQQHVHHREVVRPQPIPHFPSLATLLLELVHQFFYHVEVDSANQPLLQVKHVGFAQVFDGGAYQNQVDVAGEFGKEFVLLLLLVQRTVSFIQLGHSHEASDETAPEPLPQVDVVAATRVSAQLRPYS